MWTHSEYSEYQQELINTAVKIEKNERKFENKPVFFKNCLQSLAHKKKKKKN